MTDRRHDSSSLTGWDRVTPDPPTPGGNPAQREPGQPQPGQQPPTEEKAAEGPVPTGTGEPGAPLTGELLPRALRGGDREPPSRWGPSSAARFGWVLILLLATFIVLAAAPRSPWATVLNTVLQATTLLASLYAARSGRVLWRIAVVVCALSMVGALLEALLGTPDQRDAYSLVELMLVAAAPAAIVGGILRRRRLDIQTVLGALCVYVLIGLLWAFAYGAMDALGSGPFFAQTAHADTSDFVYFSFVTLTTTGYGDLTAAGGLGRATAVLEALLGQLYLVTVVAVLVGHLGPRRRD